MSGAKQAAAPGGTALVYQPSLVVFRMGGTAKTYLIELAARNGSQPAFLGNDAAAMTISIVFQNLGADLLAYFER